MTATKATVVIPTRDRPDTLHKCLMTVLNQDYPVLEVIVSDNAGGPATTEVIESFGDPRIRHLRTPARLSMSHNFEFALGHVTEGWITVLGDDDGLLPDSLGGAIAKVEASGLQAMSSFNCGYHWPQRRDGRVSTLSVPMGSKTWRVNARRALERVIDWRMDRLVLPQLYTGGLVHHDLYSRIKAIKGAFFQSQIPDIYSGFAICSSVEEYLCTDQPFAIAGSSGHSNGAALFDLQKTAFLDEGNIPWHEDMPLPEWGSLAFSMPAIVCESFLQSRYLRQDGPEFSYVDMARLISSESHIGQDILRSWIDDFARHHGLDPAACTASSQRPLRRRLAAVRQRVDNLVSRYRIGHAAKDQIPDVFAASVAAQTILKTRPPRLSGLLQTVRRNAGAQA